MKTKFSGFLTLFLAFMVQLTFAQQKTVSGTVSDETGPLPGVTILIKGTSSGTETDFDGNYSISANTGDILVFSFVGMASKEVKVGASNTVSVVLESDNLLEEVVVVGYGTTTKEAYTGTATVVSTENLEAKAVSNISQALVGEVAGVSVINTSGQPGSSATIRIRGFGSVNGNSEPLYIVDGVPFENALSNINPNDIASTTILKDATATSIYGSRGSNGVVVITTKKGRAGHSDITVEVKTGINMRGTPDYDRITNEEEYIGTAWQALRNTGEYLNDPDPITYANDRLFSGSGIDPQYNMWNVGSVSDLIDPTTGEVRSGVTRKYDPEDWAEYGYQAAIRTEANISMSGGSEKTTYFSSFGYLQDNGFLVNSDYDRLTTRLNITHQPTTWLEASANLDYTYGEQTANGQSSDSGSIFWFSDNIPTIYPLFLRDSDGNIVQDPIYGGNQYDYGVGRGFGGLTNAIADANFDLDENKRHSFNGNFSFKLNLAEGLTLTTTYAANYYSYTDNTINNPFYGSAAGQGGSLFKEQRNALTQNFLQMLNYKKSFGDHSIELLAAHENNDWKRERTYISKNTVVNLFNGLDDPNNYVNVGSDPSGYTEESAIESYFGQANYNFAQKYYLSASIRRDGTSRFANNKWGTFWSVGGSWILSKENFMSNVSFLDYLKLKASYGVQGDNRGVGYYSGQEGYDIDVLDGDISLIVRARENPNLTWESGTQYQVGTEFRLFNNVLDVAVDYYSRETDDLIFDARLPISTGDAIETVNDGSLKNTGFEFDITTHIVNKDDFKLDFGINGQMVKNEFTSMPYDAAAGREKLIDINGRFGRATGHSLYDYYMPVWAGVDPADGAAMWEQNYFDLNSNGSYDSGEEILDLHEYKIENPTNEISQALTKTYADATNKFTGESSIPDLNGAFRLSAQWHNFTLSTQFTFSVGGTAYDSNYAQIMDNDQAGSSSYHADMRQSWKQPGDITDVPRLYSNQNITSNYTSTRFLISADYLALNNIRLGYDLPKDFMKKAGLQGVSLWLSGDNLFLSTARKGFNPSIDVAAASDWYSYTPLTNFTLGVRVKI